MGIYAPHQKMPSSAGMCSVKINPEERKCIFTGKVFEETLGLLIEHRCKDCPLVEVAEPHGRLIDDSKWHKRLQKQAMRLYGNDAKTYQLIMDIMDAIHTEPAVIEAEGE